MHLSVCPGVVVALGLAVSGGDAATPESQQRFMRFDLKG